VTVDEAPGDEGNPERVADVLVEAEIVTAAVSDTVPELVAWLGVGDAVTTA
jgi:hypothetical protein